MTMYRRHGKRTVDLLVSLVAVFVLIPFAAVLGCVVKYLLGSPILFHQHRPGFYGEPFTLYKFRTMTDARDAQGNLLPDADRMTNFGRFLRTTSLDELPELWNVLKGDMSLVGPRPLLMRYMDRYTVEQMRRHEVRPGITGLAQVNGRNAITWEQKFQYDIWYVDNLSLFVDAKIIALTLYTILKREGISQSGQATMQEFEGTQNNRRS